MKIDDATVIRVAELANLKLSEAEVKHYNGQLSKILEYVDQVSKLDDKLGEWRGDTLGESTKERPDTTETSLTVDEAMANAPKKIGTAFQVPRIIE